MTNPLRQTRGGITPVALALLLLVAGCNWPGKPDPANRPVPQDKVMDFTTLFAENCSGCHGEKGKMGPAPPLNDPLFLAIIPDAELLHVIQNGRHGTPMPAFAKAQGGSLTDAQVKVLAEGIKPRWGKEVTEPKSKLPPYRASAKGNAERGKDVFMRACMGCHGDQGEGEEKDGQRHNRIHEPAFLALISNQALRRIVITGRPDLGMPSYAERPNEADFKPLTPAEIDDVVALLASWAPERPGQGKRKNRPAGPASGVQ
jgi:cytochrome c oxidase cbb3-type subunit 3